MYLEAVLAVLLRSAFHSNTCNSLKTSGGDESHLIS